MAEGDAPSDLLFEDVVFSMIPSEELEQWQVKELSTAITTSGGRHVPLREHDQSIDDIDHVTHIISTHVDFPQYSQCLDRGIYVVKPSWVLTSVHKKKQTSPRQHSPDPSQYFQDVVVTCGDLPEGDKEAIAAGVIALGGVHSSGLTKIVTHLVTNTLNHQKCQVVEQKGLDVKLVLPHWFDACVKLGKKIREKPYLFPDPEVMRRVNLSAPRPSPTPQLHGASSIITAEQFGSTPPPSPAKSRLWLNAFMGKRVYLADDLELSDHLRTTLVGLVEQGGGTVTNEVDLCGIYIGYFRDGPAYLQASRAGKEVANLAWLYHVINRNKYTSPLQKLLHYPVPRGGVPGFQNLKISLSNYSGEARTYVENLIRFSGAEYTKTMKQDNTHLITAHKNGEKCEAAQEWNISIVNHLWLEESFAKCVIQSISNPKYTHFPARTNLGEVTGQTSVDMKSVERHFFAKSKSPQKPKLKEQPASREAVPVSSTLKCAAPVSDAMDVDVPPPVEEEDEPQEDEEHADAEQQPASKTTQKSRGRPRKSDAASVATPRLPRENNSPMITSTGRASKQKALSSLHTQAEDIALYQKESKRKGGVVYGGRRASHADDSVSSPAPANRTSKKRASDEYEASALDPDLSDGETQQVGSKQKKAKTAASPRLPEVKYKMMVTGDDRWVENTRKENADKSILRQLGVELTTDPKDVDILVAPKLLRTKKFVCALAGAPLVVDTSFLDTALTKKKLIEDPHMLKDREGEERLGFKLTESLERAEVNDRKLFRGWSIYVTSDVKGGFDTYKDIIKLNGGNAFEYRGRTGMKFPKRQPLEDDSDAGAESQNQGEDSGLNRVYLVSGPSDAEVKLWKTFRNEAKKQALEARVVTPDWLLNSALSQQIVSGDKFLHDHESLTSQRAG
ncbi:uncharacterized protein MYCFIDRAFT_213487 [Pseudocercospora fijiensis CIRAD86]|uniref:BRCT domain-containing protein n=1 Tax=Pseudocercospora fijiensis (strain CIRAD86) TaxID=383855 RepID=N1QC64_PSEFD|nr:uncharacterized protein MYCFIDRAFT_213487 [Pseudocercospora fijiensis CIRAD86]EME88982.1 hypothetical protein MYCFIDRAFT_213487 [Pseudocercospora fijiensis CIRAD86]